MCDQYPGAYNLHKGFEDGADHGGLIGLARDGHLVYGPYTENGELWSQDQLDVCGGTYLSDGQYAYVSTITFPYNMGCWGQNHRNCVGPFDSAVNPLV